MNDLRSLPSIDKLLQDPAIEEIIGQYGRQFSVDAMRNTLEEIRRNHVQDKEIPSADEILKRVTNRLSKSLQPTMVPVINATGVIIHTNLGRAPLSQSALRAITNAAAGFSNLEYDLEKGTRGSRTTHAEDILKIITGAEAALVVNNNAGGVLLVLAAMARGKRVIISRSQLIEIGGGFRIPEVMKQSGAKLVEIGTTNRVHLEDFEIALQTPAGAVLRAHSSNFRLIGFTTEPELTAIAELAHRHDTPMIDDLGSGALVDTSQYGLGHEPTVQESLQAGVDVVCFSGDKLVGAPQAGIIVGRTRYIDRIKKHPLARAVRADKMCLAGLNATLTHYLKQDYEEQIPIWMMISAPIDSIKGRAWDWMKALGRGEVIQGESTVGGGSLPGETLPTYLLVLPDKQPDLILRRLRRADPPVIARIVQDRAAFDPRTVILNQEAALLAAIRQATDH